MTDISLYIGKLFMILHFSFVLLLTFGFELS